MDNPFFGKVPGTLQEHEESTGGVREEENASEDRDVITTDKHEDEDASAPYASGDSSEDRNVLTNIKHEDEDGSTPMEEYRRGYDEGYQKGLIDGRNQQIEERFFPRNEDGIPQLRGGGMDKGGGIFAIARG